MWKGSWPNRGEGSQCFLQTPLEIITQVVGCVLMSCRNCPRKMKERHLMQRHLDMQRPRMGQEQGHPETVPATLAEKRPLW